MIACLPVAWNVGVAIFTVVVCVGCTYTSVKSQRMLQESRKNTERAVRLLRGRKLQ